MLGSRIDVTEPELLSTLRGRDRTSEQGSYLSMGFAARRNLVALKHWIIPMGDTSSELRERFRSGWKLPLEG